MLVPPARSGGPGMWQRPPARADNARIVVLKGSYLRMSSRISFNAVSTSASK